VSRSQIRRPSGPAGLGTRDDGCTILHVDMDAFYASVELRFRPELRGKPVIVGAGQRGVVLSATYQARALGVHSAMPVSRAKRIAPQAIFIEPDHQAYAEVSRNVMALFTSITPLVEPLSLDEAFLDIAGAQRRLGSPTSIAEMIRSRIADEQLITCSVGVATTKFVAKLASTTCKPDGMLIVPADAVIEFLHPLPVGALWGVGDRTEEQLHRLGLTTVGDVAHASLQTLQRALGPAAGRHLHDLAWGRDPRQVVAHEADKSVGAETTFPADLDDAAAIHAHLLNLADRVGVRLRSSEHVGRTIQLKVRFADFSTVTRSRTLSQATDVTQEIYRTARTLFDDLGLQRVRIRLVGIRVEGLQPRSAAVQQLALGEPAVGMREAEQAMDQLRRRFGPGAIRPARLVDLTDSEPPA